jgi:hypothetical protein
VNWNGRQLNFQIEGPPSPPKDFDTQTGIVAPDQPLVHLDTEDNVLRVPAGTDYTVEWLVEWEWK